MRTVQFRTDQEEAYHACRPIDGCGHSVLCGVALRRIRPDRDQQDRDPGRMFLPERREKIHQGRLFLRGARPHRANPTLFDGDPGRHARRRHVLQALRQHPGLLRRQRAANREGPVPAAARDIDVRQTSSQRLASRPPQPMRTSSPRGRSDSSSWAGCAITRAWTS